MGYVSKAAGVWTEAGWVCTVNHTQLLSRPQQLMERLKRIVKLPHRLRPVQSSKVSGSVVGPPLCPTRGLTRCLLQINTDYRSEFACCLEPLLLLGPRCPPAAVATR